MFLPSLAFSEQRNVATANSGHASTSKTRVAPYSHAGTTPVQSTSATGGKAHDICGQISSLCLLNKEVSIFSADLHGAGVSFASVNDGPYGGANSIDNGTLFPPRSGSYASSFAGFATGTVPTSPTINPIHKAADQLAEIVRDSGLDALGLPVTIDDAFAVSGSESGSAAPAPSRDIEKDQGDSEAPVFPPLVAKDQYDPGLTTITPSKGPGVSAPLLTASAIPEPFTLPMFVAGLIGALIMATRGRLFSELFTLLQFLKWSRKRLPA